MPKIQLERSTEGSLIFSQNDFPWPFMFIVFSFVFVFRMICGSRVKVELSHGRTKSDRGGGFRGEGRRGEVLRRRSRYI